MPFLECKKAVVSGNTSELSDYSISQKSDLGHRSNKIQIPGWVDGSVGKVPKDISSDPQQPHNNSSTEACFCKPGAGAWTQVDPVVH